MSSIPIVINNRNWLTSTKKLVDDLWELGYNNIWILDNDSTYLPLLDWYKKAQHQVQVEYMGKNVGQQALWKYGILNMFKKHPYIVYTDSDIELNPNTPVGFVETLIELANQHNVEKVGLAINYLDIPDNKGNNASRRIEENYWKKQIPHKDFELYEAYIDTTFAVVRTASVYSWAHKAIRVAGDFTCKHTPWYLDYNNLTEEQQYYFDNADPKYCSYKRLMK